MNFRENISLLIKNIMQNQSFITKLILKLGLAKNEKQVPVVLLAIVALAIVITFIAWPKSGDSKRVSPAKFITIINTQQNA